jgi:ribosomal protein S18 acetylase RimI-like enzyme
MDYSFIIRKATPEDAKAIKLILQESFKKYMQDTGLVGTMEALEETVDCIKNEIETKEVFVAFINGAPAGTIRVEIFPDNTAYISRFGVRPQYQNIGVGKGLMSIVDKLLISKGVKKASLHTASKYKELMRFYYGRGFYVDFTSRDKGYIRALMVKEYP